MHVTVGVTGINKIAKAKINDDNGDGCIGAQR